ncbi:MAG: alpha/beta hydrolase [Bacteroidales bacterium]|nr:alpha/beta hydrolase [Bacteroidales bacterium]
MMINYTKYFKSTSLPWVTFIHGAGGSSSIWFRQIKSFAKKYNVLLIDLRGHGNSKTNVLHGMRKKYTLDNIALDVLEVMDYEKIEKSHFAGISLGTIVIRQIAEDHPERVESMIMGGAIMKLNVRSQILMRIGFIFKSIFPYLFLYKFFAFIIMPKDTHKESRNLFVREAKKLYQQEFIKWYKMTADINPILRLFRNIELPIPTLYIMGEEDHMFLPSIQQLMKKHTSFSKLIIVENCGHVVNVDKTEIFNTEVSNFIDGLTLK